MSSELARRKLLFGVTIVAASLVGLVVWAVSFQVQPGAVQPSSSGQSAERVGSIQSVAGGSGGAVALTSSDVDTLAQRAASQSKLSEARRVSLHNAIADTLLVYGSGEFEDWLAYLDSYSIPRPEVAGTNPEYAGRLWNMSREFFQSMRLDASGVTVGDHVTDEVSESPEHRIGGANLSEPGRYTIRRSRSRRALGSVPASEKRIASITYPGEFVSRSGEPFLGEFQMIFTLDSGRGVWVITEISVIGSDVNAAPAVPPIAF